eukprot:509024_1
MHGFSFEAHVLPVLSTVLSQLYGDDAPFILAIISIFGKLCVILQYHSPSRDTLHTMLVTRPDSTSPSSESRLLHTLESGDSIQAIRGGCTTALMLVSHDFGLEAVIAFPPLTTKWVKDPQRSTRNLRIPACPRGGVTN